MTVRDKAGLRTLIENRLANNTAGDISAADMREVLTDIVDSLELAPVVTPDHRIYALWSSSAAIPSASQFLAGASSDDQTMINPGTFAGGSAYLHFATIAPMLTDIRQMGSAFNSRDQFSANPATRSIGGTNHFVFSSQATIRVRNVPWTLTE